MKHLFPQNVFLPYESTIEKMATVKDPSHLLTNSKTGCFGFFSCILRQMESLCLISRGQSSVSACCSFSLGPAAHWDAPCENRPPGGITHLSSCSSIHSPYIQITSLGSPALSSVNDVLNATKRQGGKEVFHCMMNPMFPDLITIFVFHAVFLKMMIVLITLTSFYE